MHINTDGHMLHCVEPRRTTRTGSWEATGKFLQAPAASSLGRYKTGMRKLRQTHMARPEWGPYKIVE